jgi:rfaE bifunctional protein nucleotidyltransferase chain/domain
MIKIFVNGSFDIVHLGHIALLNFAKSQGDHLTVGIDSDSRIKQLKGEARPINNQVERKTLLENLRSVDNIVIFDTNQELINLVADCDIMVKGSDYLNKSIIGSDVCPKILFFDRIHGYSTTEKIQSIANR